MPKFAIVLTCTFFAAIFLSAFARDATAASDLVITLRDTDGAPISDAVVTVRLMNGATTKQAAIKSVHSVNQKDTAYDPVVSVVSSGAPVEFINSDSWGHHVYSFSKAKKFDITVPAGTTSKPVIFDKPGVVVIGCNIHDRMLAYIYVNGTGLPAKSGKLGIARFLDLEAGDYVVSVWHPQLKSKRNAPTIDITLGESGEYQREISVQLKRKSKKKRKPYKY